MLISIANEAANDALAALQRHNVAASRIGSVVQKKSPLILVA
ncbi:MAG TPA: hypothetical protein VGF20_12805 [Candidatus Acidoferrum sp.]